MGRRRKVAETKRNQAASATASAATTTTTTMRATERRLARTLLVGQRFRGSPNGPAGAGAKGGIRLRLRGPRPDAGAPRWSSGEPKAAIGRKSPKKIAVAMSGGVDSSVAAYLLAERHPAGELVGIHMSNWDYHDEDPSTAGSGRPGRESSHCWEQDWKDAVAVSERLGIPIHHVSFQAEYWNDVFEPYCQKLSRSVTPNPDVDCNRYIKFGALKEYLGERFGGGIDRLATGHYARLWDRSRDEEMPDCLQRALEEEESSLLADYLLRPSVAGDPVLLAARDRSKDQSYFLSGVPARAFSGVVFPLGDLYKTDGRHRLNNSNKNKNKNNNSNSNDSVADGGHGMPSVRDLARQARLPNASKKDSVGICFIGKRRHGDFISEYLDHPLGSSPPEKSVVECVHVETGEVVSTFDPLEAPSLAYATVGQGARLSGAAQKWFVVERQLRPPQDKAGTAAVACGRWESPRVVVCPGTHHPSLYTDTFRIRSDSFNWTAGGGDCNEPPPLPFRARCRIRHLQPLVDCEVRLADAGGDGDGRCYEVVLGTPLRGVAPGQVCVLYAGGAGGDLVCLGGGPIEERGPSYWEAQRDLPEALHPSGHNDAGVPSSSGPGGR